MRKHTSGQCWHCGRPTTHPSGLCTNTDKGRKWVFGRKRLKRFVGCLEAGKLASSERTTTSLVCVNGRWMNRKNAKRALGLAAKAGAA